MIKTQCGVRILGSGSAVPPCVVTNKDLEKRLDTNDEWIIQRTGIRQRHASDLDKGEGVLALSKESMQKALDDAGMKGSELDLVIVATVTGDMTCPSVAARVAEHVGATPAGAFDLGAACSGFVYGINVAESLIISGRYKTIGLVGCDTLTTVGDYTNRRVSILCGDGAGAVVLQRDDDPNVGCLAQNMKSDGARWDFLYIPQHERDVPEGADWNEIKLDYLQMKGREVFKFAVNTFPESLHEAMTEAGITSDDLKMVVAHQSNMRILDATCKRLNLAKEKIYINIQRYGNCSAGSVPLCFDELWHSKRLVRGDVIAFVALGGGMTWSTCIWRL